jgi:hypothetical protein
VFFLHVSHLHHQFVQAPSTYIEGSKPIDGIFTTSGISMQGSGYLAFSEGVKGKPDHRAAWIDVTMTSTLGYKIPTTVRPSMQRVTTKDMRSVQAFNKAMHVFVKHHQLGERITKLESTIHYPPTAAEQRDEETLMQLRLEGIRAADRVCKKLRTGAMQRLSTSMVIALNETNEWTERTTKQDMPGFVRGYGILLFFHS